MTFGGFPFSAGGTTGFAIPNTTVATAPSVGLGKGFPLAKGFGGVPFGKGFPFAKGCGGVPFGKGFPASVGGSTGFIVPNTSFATVPW